MLFGHVFCPSIFHELSKENVEPIISYFLTVKSCFSDKEVGPGTRQKGLFV
jgi:hypothetical protein